ncbi:Disabled homolog 2-interacting protein [Lepeophtheirus salmonis]|uniref:Disabled homolog 2-interacting protein n=1 Tax=Lepeophtheirus salmonis TaxID=72036 RepID=A0A0K2SZK7_LEPSM|nr:ras GTPase-activating protein raskol-like [Lepeophtheirus salmonis]CAB4065495.1 Disabled homolog 2-interacting protein [Lepeophtheirus salmonis]CAF2958161.1 Disabled homolog 2-interacting protein [Lepeophtheirus salmonis]
MKESRWRSISIMDLHKRKSVNTETTSSSSSSSTPPSNSSQFELIKTTQNLVDRLHLNAEDITIQPVHPSIIGEDTWFQITYNSSGTTRYFTCHNAKERDEWILNLKRTLLLAEEDRRRTENSLKLGVLEVKGLSDKNRYFVEIYLDDKLYARTASKKMTGMCFWGEHFEFKDLPSSVERIQLFIHKDKGSHPHPSHHPRRSSAKKKPVGRVRISVPSVQSRYVQEKWHMVEKSSKRESPSIRLKCQFQSVDILPLREYDDFLYFLKDEFKSLVKLLEPVISVKVKEELSLSLMSVYHLEDIAEDVLTEIVVGEISNVENEHLTFRGNSIATKAMEAYIKLVGQKYLKGTLQNVIKDIIAGDQDLEIDPVKVTNPDTLSIHRTLLRNRVKQVWHRIMNSHSNFPIQLQRCFFKIRQYLKAVGRPDRGDNLISSCIFLRYLCPAILSPSLFNLIDEYPGDRANRNLTLIAKILQTLANFTLYEGKENSLEFLNPFLEGESDSMKKFLNQISSEDSWNFSTSNHADRFDLGRHLSCVHSILFENISLIPQDHSTSIKLRQVLDDINCSLRRPTLPELEQISQPTLKTLEKLSRQNQAPEKSFASGLQQLAWSWTLPKKTRNYSHPAPHHEAPKAQFFVKGTTGNNNVVSSNGVNNVDGSVGVASSDTSSSASMTPSPGLQIKDSRRTWPSQNQCHPRRSTSKLFTSSMSLDDTDSSDDSTYSSPSDVPNMARTNSTSSSTLPRPCCKPTRSLTEYESEILELRSNMESLQHKLNETERKLRVVANKDESNHVNRTLQRLSIEEDMLRRQEINSLGDKEMMILMQQKKIAALDDANGRLKTELTRLGDKLKQQQQQAEFMSVVHSGDSPVRVFHKSSSVSMETPKTVDELLDSLHSTPI